MMGIKQSQGIREKELLRMPPPHMRHCRMDRSHRAKQFAPFAALSGFEECIYKQELLYRCEGEAERIGIYYDLLPEGDDRIEFV